MLIYVVFCSSWQATDAIEIMLLSVLSPEVRCEWKLQDWEVAMISTVSSFPRWSYISSSQ